MGWMSPSWRASLIQLLTTDEEVKGLGEVLEVQKDDTACVVDGILVVCTDGRERRCFLRMEQC